MQFQGRTEEYIELISINHGNCRILTEALNDALAVIWSDTGGNQLIVDGELYTFKKNQIAFITEFHKLETKKVDSIRFLRFNRPFYCVIENDHEVSCRGALFFGASNLPLINIPPKELEIFEILWKMFTIEMHSSDHLQMEMLQIMLKRYLILCTRLYKLQANFPVSMEESNLVRQFNYLVELHFKSKHTVAEYAELMSKSPKTVSNIFSKVNAKTPLQYIQDRIMLEAKRLLRYSELQVQEVAYSIGFDSVQSFSRFFRNKQGISPSKYKVYSPLGKIANH